MAGAGPGLGEGFPFPDVDPLPFEVPELPLDDPPDEAPGLAALGDAPAEAKFEDGEADPPPHPTKATQAAKAYTPTAHLRNPVSLHGENMNPPLCSSPTE